MVHQPVTDATIPTVMAKMDRGELSKDTLACG